MLSTRIGCRSRGRDDELRRLLDEELGPTTRQIACAPIQVAHPFGGHNFACPPSAAAAATTTISTSHHSHENPHTTCLGPSLPLFVRRHRRCHRQHQVLGPIQARQRQRLERPRVVVRRLGLSARVARRGWDEPYSTDAQIVRDGRRGAGRGGCRAVQRRVRADRGGVASRRQRGGCTHTTPGVRFAGSARARQRNVCYTDTPCTST